MARMTRTAPGAMLERGLQAPADLRAGIVKFRKREFLVLSFPSPHPEALSQLTAAELSIALEVLRGASNAAIARQCGTSVRTVANQLRTIYRKLAIRSRRELARRLQRATARTP